LIDGQSSGFCHVREVTLRLLRDARVRVITLPPHTMQIFQQLDIEGVRKVLTAHRLPINMRNIKQIFTTSDNMS
jgi:hypothetical protein